MKLKQIILPLRAYIYGFMALILLSTGCSKELEFKTNKSIDAETLDTVDKTAVIEDAKQWYEGQLKTPLPSRLPKVLKDRNAIQPLWEQAIVTPISVEVPYLTNGEIISPSLSDKEDAQKGKGVIVVYRKGFKGKERTGRIWEFMPSEKSKGDMTTMTTLNFKKRQFDGLIAVWHLIGVNLGGYVIEQGTFKKKMYAKINPKANSSLGVRDECAFCDTETYSCHCGSVMGGLRQCSTCEKQVCYDWWGLSCNPNDGCEHVPDSCAENEDGCNGAPNPDCNPCDADPSACGEDDEDDGYTGYTVEPTVVIVTNLCESTMSESFVEKGTQSGPWIDGSGGKFPYQNIHAITTRFKDLQVAGINDLNIPLFEITAYTLATREFTPAVLGVVGNKLAEAFDETRRGFVFNGTIPDAFIFTDEWAKVFNTKNNGSYSIDFTINQSADPTDAQKNTATSVQDRSSSDCKK
jgi:hypothetical protein